MAADFGVPSTVIIFLGIVIDTVNMECRLPDDKLLALREEVRRVASLKKGAAGSVAIPFGETEFCL